MPKNTETTAETPSTAEQNEQASATARKSLTVNGISVDVNFPKYSEGHVLNANEASTLNQTYLENIRNNTAGRVKKAIKEWIAAGAKDLPEGAENPNTEENFTASDELLTSIQEYADAYEFGQARVANLEPADPVEKEARKIAKEAVNAALKAKDIKIKDVPDEKYEALIAAQAAKPAVIEEAKRRLDVAKQVGSEELDLSGITG